MKDYRIQHEKCGPIQIVRLAGALDLSSFHELELQLTKLLHHGRFAVLLDCKELDYIGSVGLGVLAGFAKSSRAKGGDLKLINVNASICKIIRTLGFTGDLPVHHKKDEAVASFVRDWTGRAVAAV